MPTLNGRNANPACTGEYPRIVCMKMPRNRNIANIPAPTISDEMWRPARFESRMTRSGSRGWVDRLSMMKNATSQTAAESEPDQGAGVQWAESRNRQAQPA